MIPSKGRMDRCVNVVPVVEANIKRLHDRSQVGMKTYGFTMEDNPASAVAWLDHAIEEALDLANYLERLKREIQKNV